MATIVTRSGKGSPLTNTELDANFTNLNTDKLESLADDSVTTAKVADDAITSAKIADDAVVTAAIADDAITSALIADDAVVQAAIADDAVDEARLQISNSGTNGHTLTYQSGNTGKLTWAAAGGGVDGITSSADGTAIVIDSSERVTTPANPSFCYRVNANVSNVTGDDTRYEIIFNAEEWEVGGSNFDTSTGGFTCPVAGVYSFSAGIALEGLTSSHNRFQTSFYDGNDTWYQYALAASEVKTDTNRMYCPISHTLYCSASTVVKVSVQVFNGSKVVDITGAGYPWTWFSGALIG